MPRNSGYPLHGDFLGLSDMEHWLDSSEILYTMPLSGGHLKEAKGQLDGTEVGSNAGEAL